MTVGGSAWRQGLGFSEEVAVLSWLRVGRPAGLERLPAVARSALPTTPDARERLARELYGDLVAAPARIVRHPEWLELRRSRLPADARGALGRDGRAESASPRLRATWPCVSGRHRQSRELGRLALLPPALGEAVRAWATRRALNLMLRALGSRQRLALLSVLGGPDGPDLRAFQESGEETADETLRLLTVESFRAGFARAAATARSAEHLLDRFGTFVLAHALGAGHAVEARALAETLPLKAGRRLLRYHVRAVGSPRGLTEDARRAVELGLREAVSVGSEERP